jgi:predicted RNA binding protein YcfA (HicA-like mRNA interferase family)
MPRVTGGELLRALRRLGWREVEQRGSHVQLEHSAKRGKVTVPIHSGRVIGPWLLSRILDQAGMTVDELRSAL